MKVNNTIKKISKTIIYVYIVNRDLSNTPLVNQKNSNISYISNNKIKTQEITWNVGNDKIFLKVSTYL
jgi:hypothetical protein